MVSVLILVNYNDPAAHSSAQLYLVTNLFERFDANLANPVTSSSSLYKWSKCV